MDRLERIIQEEIMLRESMDFSIKGYDDDYADSIISVKHILLRMLDKWYQALPPEEKQRYKSEKSNGYVFDTDYYLEPDDEIYFTTQGLSEDQKQELMKLVQQTLAKYEVKTLNLNDNGKVITYKVELPEVNTAPSLNLANSNALQLVQLLGYEAESEADAQRHFTIDELQKGVERARYYMNEPDSGLVDKSQHTRAEKETDGMFAGSQSIKFSLGKDRVEYYLDTLQEMITYAKEKGYQEITLF